MATATLKTLHSFLKEHTTETSSGTTVKSYSHDNGSDTILCMVHGYPQSSFMSILPPCARFHLYLLEQVAPCNPSPLGITHYQPSYTIQVVPSLKDHASLFIPELPGYGISSMPPTPDKKAIGEIIIEALRKTFPDRKRPIIWCSHDRGARVGHRLLVNPGPGHNIVAAVFMDIVPTLEQWKSFSNPEASAAYFHWPFLATSTAPEMIEAMGGAKFCRMLLERGRIGPQAAIEKLKADGAYEHYCEQFSKPETIRGSCADYADGALPECQAQEADQKAGRKVSVPTLVIYSGGSLARMHNVQACWEPWVDGKLECVEIGDGHGHYLPESAPDQVAQHVVRWLRVKSVM